MSFGGCASVSPRRLGRPARRHMVETVGRYNVRRQSPLIIGQSPCVITLRLFDSTSHERLPRKRQACIAIRVVVTATRCRGSCGVVRLMLEGLRGGALFHVRGVGW
jgi:hypothetical protein